MKITTTATHSDPLLSRGSGHVLELGLAQHQSEQGGQGTSHCHSKDKKHRVRTNLSTSQDSVVLTNTELGSGT